MVQVLSQQLLFASALLKGGAHLKDIVRQLQEFELPQAESKSLQMWRLELNSILEGAVISGASCSVLLQTSSGLVSQEERRHHQMKALEAQFFLQAAILFVLPWVVVATASDHFWGWACMIGLVWQILGMGAMFLLLKRIRNYESEEVRFLQTFTAKVWMQLSTGENLYLSMQEALQMDSNWSTSNKFLRAWAKWMDSRDRLRSAKEHFSIEELSAALAPVLEHFIQQGAPAIEFLEQYLCYLDRIKQFQWEKGMATLPTYLSLVFCVFFAPSFFFILLAGIWHDLTQMTM